MKRIVALILSALLVLCFTSCQTEEKTEETTVDESTVVPVVSLVCDNTTVKAGETVELRVNVRNSLFTACFDIYVIADELLVYESNRTSAGSMMMAANFEEKDGISRVAIRGIVAETYDLPDNDICTVTYKVSEEAVTGDVINVILQVPSYQLGLDESGNDVYSVNDEIILNNITLTVG